MKTGIFALPVATLLTSVSSSVCGHGHGHAAFHKKRDIKIVTDVVTETILEVCNPICTTVSDASINAAPVVATPTTLATSISAAGIPSQVGSPAVVGNSPSVAAAAPSSSAMTASVISATPQAVVSSQPAAQSSTTSSAAYKGNNLAANSGSGASGRTNSLNRPLSSNGALGITYTSFNGKSASDNSCKSPSDIKSDITAIHSAGFNTIRLYAPTDCNQLDAVYQATQSLGMSMVLGIFLSSASSAQSDFNGQLKAITDYFAPGSPQSGFPGVALVTVGNEALFNKYVDVGTLSGWLDQARSSLTGAGYTGPLSTVDIVSTWGSNKDLCSHVDVIASNIQPFYADNLVDPTKAGEYVDGQISDLQSVCNGKSVVITEAGWPTQGPQNNGMTPSAANQQAFVQSLGKSKNANSIMYFSNQNDAWKAAPGVAEWEMWFGCLGSFQS